MVFPRFDLVLILVSGMLLNLDDQRSVILDCGEGTLATMKRVLPPKEFKQVLHNLGLIYISHLHADHHLGLVGLLKEYITLQESLPLDSRKPVFIIAPFRLIASIYEYSQLEDLKLDEYLVPFHATDLIPEYLRNINNQNPRLADPGLLNGLYHALSLKSIETCYVTHCQAAYGIAITDKSGFKVVYSGDTRPCPELVEIGKDASLLIHEATFADTELDAALDKMHSTTSEAIDIGRRMNAKNVLLTHFSQRHVRVPEFVLRWEKMPAAERAKFENVGIAFDRMRVRVGDLWKVTRMYPLLEKMYFKDEMESRRVKSALKRKAREMEGGEEGSRKKVEIVSFVDTASEPVREQQVG
jgi:ribonuclease Z